MSESSKKYFDDKGMIRGRANRGKKATADTKAVPAITPPFVMQLGMALGLHFANGHALAVVLGKDPRGPNYVLENAMNTGLLSVGAYVYQVGPIPRPGVALLTRSLRHDFGVMLSGSAALYDEVGIAIFDAEGKPLSEEAQRKIEELLDSDLMPRLAEPRDVGRAERVVGALERYVEAIKLTLPPRVDFQGVRVVIDCANGAGYQAGPAVLRELGAEVFTVGVNPDGFNINLNGGLALIGVAQNEVKKYRADVGFALDGDGDSVGVIDEQGRVVETSDLARTIPNLATDDGLVVALQVLQAMRERNCTASMLRAEV